MSTRNALLEDLVDPVTKYAGLSTPRLSTVNPTQIEIATLLGDRYSAQAYFTLAAGGTQYLQFTMPSVGDGVVAVFTLRNLQADDGVYFNLYWDPVGVTKGDSLNIFNENQFNPKISKMDYTLVTGAPTSLGVLREAEASNPASQGAIKSPATQIGAAEGYRVYDQGRQALIEIENRGSDDNSVILSYGWVEAPLALFE